MTPDDYERIPCTAAECFEHTGPSMKTEVWGDSFSSVSYFNLVPKKKVFSSQMHRCMKCGCIYYLREDREKCCKPDRFAAIDALIELEFPASRFGWQVKFYRDFARAIVKLIEEKK